MYITAAAMKATDCKIWKRPEAPLDLVGSTVVVVVVTGGGVVTTFTTGAATVTLTPVNPVDVWTAFTMAPARPFDVEFVEALWMLL